MTLRESAVNDRPGFALGLWDWARAPVRPLASTFKVRVGAARNLLDGEEWFSFTGHVWNPANGLRQGLSRLPAQSHFGGGERFSFVERLFVPALPVLAALGVEQYNGRQRLRATRRHRRGPQRGDCKMGRAATLPRPVGSARTSVPPLKSGDRLTRVEFERRYESMPEQKKAELIEGLAHLPSRVRIPQHAAPTASLIGWLVTYAANTAGMQVGDNGTVRLDADNEPQPDAFLRVLPEFGGQSRTSEDGYLEGAPEFVAEVAARSTSIDLHDKMNAYCRNGVREYIVWRVLESEFDWFVRREDRYERFDPDPSGVYKSEQFPGLWLDTPALLSGDMARVLAFLQQGIETPEHRRYVDRVRDGA